MSDENVFNGAYQQSGDIKDTVNVNGTAEIGSSTAKTKVHQEVKVNGELTATQTHFKSPVIVNGGAKFYNSLFEALCEVSGQLTAQNSVFKLLQLVGSKFTLENSKVDKLHVKIPHSYVWKSSITLIDSSVVDLSVEPSGKAKVILRGDSEITGKVEGVAEIIKEHKNNTLSKL